MSGQETIAQATRTELVLEARTGTTLARRWWPGAVICALLLLVIVHAVREVRRVELVLAAEGEVVTRVVAYELTPKTELHVPIEPDADLLRIAVHAMTRNRDLPMEPHPAKLTMRIKGRDGTERTEIVTASLPGIASRVTPEEGDVAAGDPVTVTLDVRARRGGEVVVRLEEVEQADAVLVRSFSREILDRKGEQQRLRSLDDKRRLEVAARAWELDFADLAAPEQAALAGRRWRKIGALRGAGDELRPHAMAIAIPPPRDPRARTETLFVGRATLTGDEIVALMADHGARLEVTAEGSPDTTLIATVRRASGTVVQQGTGTLEVPIDGEGRAGVELTATSAASIAVRAHDPSLVTWLGHTPAWRVTRERHARLRAGKSPLVVKVTAWRPMARTATDPASLAIDVLGDRLQQRFSATVPRSRFDRYDAEPAEAPSERVTFHVVVPPDKTIELAPREPAIDLALAELDTAAPPRPAPTHPKGTPAPSTNVFVLGETDWHGFVPRRPSNALLFERDGSIVVRTAHRWTTTMVKGTLPILHVARPPLQLGLDEHGHAWVPLGPLVAKLSATGAMVLPLRFSAKEKTTVTIRVDGGAIERRPGLVSHVTLDRTVVVDGDVATSIVLGDDLLPGEHKIGFSTDRPTEMKLQAPWISVRAPHWISGDFEE